MQTIVLDTNCLLMMLPSSSPYHKVWTDIVEGRISLCVSTDIVMEYEEIISRKINPQIARLIVDTILKTPLLKKVSLTFFYHLIKADPDDNKFVDCAVCANAELIVTNDTHFNILKTIKFPKVNFMTLQEFSGINLVDR